MSYITELMKTDISMNIDEISEADFETAIDWIDEGIYENPGRFAGMTYEKGMRDMLEWLAGENEDFGEMFPPRD